MLRAAETIQRTDTGRQRRGNEDASYARAPLFVVADGMGGAQAGEVASRIAVETFEQGLPDSGPPEERLVTRIHEANERIHELSQAERERAGMGTTLTAAYLDDAHLAIAHVGDCRAYMFRDGKLTRLTKDHTLVQALVDEDKLTEEEAEQHPQRSIITRALGPEASVKVDTWTYPAKSGDILLLCSDGLTSMVSERRIAQILSEASDLSRAADELIREANEAGGRDNITVVLSRLEEVGGPAEVDAPTMVGAPPALAAAGTAAAREPDTVAPPSESTVAPPASTKARVPLARTQGPPPARRPGARTAAVREAPRRPDRRPGRALPDRRRRLPGQPPALLRQHQPAGNRDDLPRVPLRPAVRHPPVRDLLRVGRAGQHRPGGPPQLTVQRPPALAGGRLEARPRSRARTGEPMSARNRELLALIPASLLVTAGFAGVFIQRSNQLSNLSGRR